MISCLTVTREGKLEDLERAVRCFDYQTVAERELVIVHDGSDTLDGGIRSLAEEYSSCDIKIERVEPGLNLGALRNQSVDRSSYDLVCQWDDDDIYHPRRLEVQFDELRAQEADFCFLTDQLHYFEPTGELYWDDWTVEVYPMSLIQGTMLGSKEHLGRYPDLPRGEDTPVVKDIVRRKCRIAQVAGRGYLYIYVYNERNAWDVRHHADQSMWKKMPKDRLLEHEAVLRSHLADYKLDVPFVMMPHEEGTLFIDLS